MNGSQKDFGKYCIENGSTVGGTILYNSPICLYYINFDDVNTCQICAITSEDMMMSIDFNNTNHLYSKLIEELDKRGFVNAPQIFSKIMFEPTYIQFNPYQVILDNIVLEGTIEEMITSPQTGEVFYPIIATKLDFS